MLFSTYILSALAMVASAAPVDPKINLAETVDASDAVHQVSTYFNLLASKVQASRASRFSPVCDLSRAKMPIALPAVSEGLKLHHVAVGRGTQNYTCDTSDPSSAPAPNGAWAHLFNASCVAALYPDLLESIPGMAIHFDVSETEPLGPSGLAPSGLHYFSNKTTPVFDLGEYGIFHGAKLNATDAPTAAAVGLAGERAVPWLKLATIDGSTANMKEVYRVDTAGGSAPATCQGLPATFEVQYATVYWFFAGDLA